MLISLSKLYTRTPNFMTEIYQCTHQKILQMQVTFKLRREYIQNDRRNGSGETRGCATL